MNSATKYGQTGAYQFTVCRSVIEAGGATHQNLPARPEQPKGKAQRLKCVVPVGTPPWRDLPDPELTPEQLQRRRQRQQQAQQMAANARALAEKERAQARADAQARQAKRAEQDNRQQQVLQGKMQRLEEIKQAEKKKAEQQKLAAAQERKLQKQQKVIATGYVLHSKKLQDNAHCVVAMLWKACGHLRLILCTMYARQVSVDDITVCDLFLVQVSHKYAFHQVHTRLAVSLHYMFIGYCQRHLSWFPLPSGGIAAAQLMPIIRMPSHCS